jgi:uncharacterized protein
MRFNLLDLLLPRETKFFTLLEQMSELLLVSTRTFYDLVVQIETLPEDDIRKRLLTIKDCEQQGDKLEVRILDELDRTFITPIDREDIQTLTLQIDKALDILNSISRRVEMYNMKAMTTYVSKFAVILAEIAQLSHELVLDLKHKRDVKAKVEAMHKLENDSDNLFHVSMAELFSEQDQFQTVKMTMHKELYEHLETAVDSIDYLGKLIRGIHMKQG